MENQGLIGKGLLVLNELDFLTILVLKKGNAIGNGTDQGVEVRAEAGIQNINLEKPEVVPVIGNDKKAVSSISFSLYR